MTNRIPTILLHDGYKAGHVFQYPPGTTLIYSNLTARSSRTSQDHVVAFGFQYFVEEYLRRQFQDTFFGQKRGTVVDYYRRRMDNYLGPNAISVDHIAALWDLGYLPLHIKAVPEGTRVPLRVPMLTIYNTRPEFFWLTNMIETLMSNILWGAITSATTAFQYRRTFEHFAEETGADKEFVPWQGHDFSFRGLTGIENASLSGAAHLLSFVGTDTIPAIDFLEEYYGANVETELVGGSVAATEHSVMCMGEPRHEQETFRRLLTEVYPTGILSIVSDTWDLWTVLTQYVPALKEVILQREGKLVIRPDSGDPLKIIVGDPEADNEAARLGVMRLLWGTFGGQWNDKGYKVLDPHIGVIYGEAISPNRQWEILAALSEQGFASSNIVFGIGSYTYQYVTRDTYGMAIKSTYGETRERGGIPIYKDPATDDGTKTSAFGLLRLDQDAAGLITVKENVTWQEEAGGLLQTIFKDGAVANTQTLAEIRARLEAALS